MKMSESISTAVFESFQKENMDPALALIDIKLSKFEKRKQVAARLLGYNAYEAIEFDELNYDYIPKPGELLVGRHPESPENIAVWTRNGAIIVNQSGAYVSMFGLHGKPLSSVTGQMLLDAERNPLGKIPFKPSHVELGFSGIKKFRIGLERMKSRQIEFDWVLGNGMVVPFHIEAFTMMLEKPSGKKESAIESFTVSNGSEFENSDDDSFTYETTMNVERKGKEDPNELRLSHAYWELKRWCGRDDWRDESGLVTESMDCLEIAYAFLSAQSTTKSKREIGHDLKSCIERWAGRYVSVDDVELAMKLHPNIVGSMRSCNLSKKLVMPSWDRLKDIPSAFTQRYRFKIENYHLDLFKFAETSEGLEPFDKASFVNSQPNRPEVWAPSPVITG